MMMDDTDSPLIDALCDHYAARRDLTRLRLARLWSPTPGFMHAMFAWHPRGSTPPRRV